MRHSNFIRACQMMLETMREDNEDYEDNAYED